MGDAPDEAARTRDGLDIPSRLGAAVFEAHADDAACHPAASGGAPRRGSRRGRDGVEARSARPDSAARGGWAAALARARVRSPATGTEREFTASAFPRVRGGGRTREFHGTTGVLEAVRRPRAA